MPVKVHITKHGIQALKWDGGVRQYTPQHCPSATHVLCCACQIEAGVTLGAIFNMVEEDRDLVKFLELWSSCDVEAFHREARTPAAGASKLACIEVSKHFEWDEHEAREVIDVSGIGEPDERGMRCYGLDFTPVNQLVHLPVRLRPAIEIHRNREKLGEAPCEFTLVDILGGIYSEISFYGSPRERDRMSAELQQITGADEDGRQD